jgi:hypothetical protein
MLGGGVGKLWDPSAMLQHQTAQGFFEAVNMPAHAVLLHLAFHTLLQAVSAGRSRPSCTA